ncbi:MAG: hypothetical protein ACI8RZ_000340 [Myxococcota bacterium]
MERLRLELIWCAQLLSRNPQALQSSAARAYAAVLQRNAHTAPPAPLPLDEIDVADFDRASFDAVHACRRPVVIRRAFADAPFVGNWSLEHFRRRFGQTDVLVHEKATQGERLNGRRAVETTFASFVDGLNAGTDARYMVASTALFAQDRSLIDDIPLQQLAERFGVQVTRAEMFIGNSNHWSPFHSAWNENFFVQVEGNKHWKFVSPDQSAFMYPDYGFASGPNAVQTAFDARHPERFPLYQLPQQYFTVLQPGDLLYNPPYWWHEVTNLNASIGMPLRVQPRESLRSPFYLISKMQILSGLRDATWRGIYRDILSDKLHRRALKETTMNDDPIRVSYPTDTPG